VIERERLQVVESGPIPSSANSTPSDASGSHIEAGDVVDVSLAALGDQRLDEPHLLLRRIMARA
jgi:hypothetical protein